ncbi:MAG: hypothetical protein ACO3EE_10015 [Flavobacteriales bacterium]
MKWIIALLLIPAALFSQKVKKINNKVTLEKYYVLKSDTSVRHGRYEKYKYNDYLLISGYYKNGKKDSIWNEYSEYSLELIANGNYVNNEKVGIWKYPQSGVLEYDHTLNKPLSYDSTFNANFCNNEKSDTLPAIYLGGKMEEDLVQYLEYP